VPIVAGFSPARIFQELRRRRVLNSVAFYIVGAWVALQVAELALPALKIPDFAIRYVWIGAFVLFPLSLIFGWRYDITTTGIKRTPASEADPDADTSLHRLDRGLIGGLTVISLAVITVLLVRIGQVEPELAVTPVANSIAVLPFKVCEDRARERELAGGLTMEVINRLAERRKLEVTARRSSVALDGVGLNLQQIAKTLAVQYLLAGEICRNSTRLTLSAELFDERGFIVWSELFTQEVNQWEQVSERLATRVASGVAAELGDVAAASPESPVNVLAYEQFLIGVAHRDRGNKDRARAAFTRALEYDPEYAEAKFYAALLDTIGFFSEGRGESIAQARPMIVEALEAARRQLELDDRSAYTHDVVAQLIRIVTKWDEELAFRWGRANDLDTQEIVRLREQIKSGYAESERHFRLSINLNPSRTESYSLLADVIERQDFARRTEALEILEKGQDRDRFNLVYNGRIAKRWAGRGQYRQAIELLERFKTLPEIPPMAWWWQLEIMHLQIYWDEKAEALVDMLLNDPGAFDEWLNRWQIWWFVGSLVDMGLREEAEAWKDRLENLPMDDWMYQKGLHNYLAAIGEYPKIPADSLHWLIENGEYEQAIEELETGRHERKMWHEREIRDDMTLISLYQASGQDDEANELLGSTAAYLEQEYAMGIRHPETLYHLSEVYARQGRDDQAVDMLRKSYDYHGLVTCSEYEDTVTASPWPRFADDPRYISTCERIQADLDRQTETIRALLARYDVDELLAPLIAQTPDESEVR
jgi:TolB-like protein